MPYAGSWGSGRCRWLLGLALRAGGSVPRALDPRGHWTPVGMAPRLFGKPREEVLAEASPSKALVTEENQTGDI